MKITPKKWLKWQKRKQVFRQDICKVVLLPGNGKGLLLLIQELLQDDLKRALDQGKTNGEIFLLDVRESDEFENWNIDNSENIPLGQIPQSIDRIPKDKEIITICPAGNRSAMVTLMLQRLGYNAKTLEDGLTSWSSTYEHVDRTFEVKEGKKSSDCSVEEDWEGLLVIHY